MPRHASTDKETAIADSVRDEAWRVLQDHGEVCSLDLAVRFKIHPAAVYRILSKSPFMRSRRPLYWEKAHGH